jgi:response regulator of citrate/malate metabolism
MATSEISDSSNTKIPAEILVVDDDSITIFLAKKTIHSFNSNAIINSFQDGRNALDYLLNRDSSAKLVILLDINMPDYSGWDFLNDYIHANLNASVFMFTSSIDPFDLAKSKTYATVKGFISKPLNKEKLEEIFKDSI